MSVPNTGRVQLALNVSDLEGSVAFYSKLFNTDPAKRKQGYANFAIDQPPLKLVLIENVNGGSINHLGVEVEDTDLVRQAGERFSVTGMDTDVENSVECCYAVQDKVWVTAPDGERWEYYTVLNDSEAMRSASTEAACCAGAPVEAACC